MWRHANNKPMNTPTNSEALPLTICSASCCHCDGTGAVDSGGVTPWGAGIEVMCPACKGSGKLECELIAVTEQRDEARRLAEKYRYLSCDSQEEADAEVLPWENNQPTKP